MRVALVVNPTSGKRRGEHIAGRAAHELGELGHHIDVIRGVDGADAGKQVNWSSPGIVAYGDGERLGPLPLTATAKPGALTLVHA